MMGNNFRHSFGSGLAFGLAIFLAVAGPARAMPGGVGTASGEAAGYVVGALAVVNALGDVLDGSGRIIAGTRSDDGGFADSARLLRDGATGLPLPPPGTNTTLCVVATNAPLDRPSLEALARAGSAGQARRTSPAHTVFDGDVTFAVSTATDVEPLAPPARLAVNALAAEVVAESIERAVARDA